MKKPLVITVPNPKLHEVTKKVTSFDDDLKTQLDIMFKTLRKEGGIGIAANQLGYPNSVIAVEFKDPDGKNHIPLKFFINPEIVEYDKEIDCQEEGCLSVPKIELDVERSQKIKIKYQDESGKVIKAAPKGLLARILQHEVDHLNGIVFTQKVKDQFFKKFVEFKNIKIVFFGSGQFASIILEGLILLGFDLDIYTETAKPAGRENALKPTPVAETAEKFQKEYHEIDNFNFENFDYDLLICADFGKKIPNDILGKAKLSAVNIHPSLLPKYVGPTPIQAAILNGDKKVGTSIIKMTDKIDQGPIYAQIETEILPDDTYPLLRDRLATLGLKLLINILPKIVRNELEFIKNEPEKMIYTKKLTKADGQIDWEKNPEEIYRQIRALYPWPGTFTLIGNKRLIIHTAKIKKGKLDLGIVQLEGKKPVKFKEFLRGFKDTKPAWFEKILI